jgi:sugar lactone lactonase YvrE
MKRFVIVLVLAALSLALIATGAASAGAARAWACSPHTVATFSPGEYGSFAEGMAADSHGALYVSLTTWGFADATAAESNVGEIWRVAAGQPRAVARMDLSPYGMLLGVAVDRRDRVYVAVYDMGAGTVGNGVYRVEGSQLTQVAAIPEGSWPNGLAFHHGRLYVTDSTNGAVWRVRLGAGIAAPTRPWAVDALLKPSGPSGIGANGIAFLGDSLYVSVADKGRIVCLPVRDDGTAGAARVVARSSSLTCADGIAFDAQGGLWIAVNSGSTGADPGGALYRLSPPGGLTAIADDPGWLNYPTQPVFGTTPGTLYMENGAFFSAYGDGTSPDVLALDVGLSSLPHW